MSDDSPRFRLDARRPCSPSRSRRAKNRRRIHRAPTRTGPTPRSDASISSLSLSNEKFEQPRLSARTDFDPSFDDVASNSRCLAVESPQIVTVTSRSGAGSWRYRGTSDVKPFEPAWSWRNDATLLEEEGADKIGP